MVQLQTVQQSGLVIEMQKLAAHMQQIDQKVTGQGQSVVGQVESILSNVEKLNCQVQGLEEHHRLADEMKKDSLGHEQRLAEHVQQLEVWVQDWVLPPMCGKRMKEHTLQMQELATRS